MLPISTQSGFEGVLYEPEDLTIAKLSKGVDLNLRSVLLPENSVQLSKDLGSVLLCALLEAKLLGELNGLLMRDTLVKVEGGGDDRVGRLVRHVLDVHTALATRHEHRRPTRAVVEHRGVIFFLRRHAFGEHDGVADTACGTGLFGDELVAEHLRRVVFGLCGAAGQEFVQ